VFGIINAIVNKLLESKWRSSSSRDSDSQSQVKRGLRQLFFIYGFGPQAPFRPSCPIQLKMRA